MHVPVSRRQSLGPVDVPTGERDEEGGRVREVPRHPHLVERGQVHQAREGDRRGKRHEGRTLPVHELPLLVQSGAVLRCRFEGTNLD